MNIYSRQKTTTRQKTRHGIFQVIQELKTLLDSNEEIDDEIASTISEDLSHSGGVRL